jgi:hypothetical protein
MVCDFPCPSARGYIAHACTRPWGWRTQCARQSPTHRADAVLAGGADELHEMIPDLVLLDFVHRLGVVLHDGPATRGGGATSNNRSVARGMCNSSMWRPGQTHDRHTDTSRCCSHKPLGGPGPCPSCTSFRGARRRTALSCRSRSCSASPRPSPPPRACAPSPRCAAQCLPPTAHPIKRGRGAQQNEMLCQS